MHIIRAISTADQSGTIYFLLTSYVDVVWQQAAAEPLPCRMLRSTYASLHDVRATLGALSLIGMRTDTAPTDHERGKITETLAVFRAALNRLELIENNGGTRTELKAACMA